MQKWRQRKKALLNTWFTSKETAHKSMFRSRGGLKSLVHFHETSLRSSSNTIRRVSSTGLHADAIVKKKKKKVFHVQIFFPKTHPNFYGDS